MKHQKRTVRKARSRPPKNLFRYRAASRDVSEPNEADGWTEHGSVLLHAHAPPHEVEHALVSVGIYAPRGQLFTLRQLRKPTRCASCGRAMAKKEVAYGEVTSCAMNRMHRVCQACIRKEER